ncbi:PAS domain S-box protein [Anatilimnocola floriformis]|uniref:PAS domain S-box protein n=1 Tax=Anatilimnocola floriformis TaxID=2948575 RepID=UPI0020C3C3EB|nr:PAS domain S-box protein [Anatilimnocola floriformis]
MRTSSGARQFGLVILFALGYCCAVVAGHLLSFKSLAFATFWPAAGVFLATLALTPKKQWWQYLLAATVLNLSMELLVYRQSMLPSLLFVLANAIEALLGALVLQRWSIGAFQFAKMRDVLVLAALSLTMPLLGAVIGTAGVKLIEPTTNYWQIFQLWWQADSIGILIIAPVQITLASRILQLESRPSFSGYGRTLEAVLLFISLNVATWGAFSPYTNSLVWNLNSLLYLVPVLAWAGLRFRRLGAAIASCNILLIIIYHTTRGDGLFALASGMPELQAMSLQSFALVTMLTPLLFATAIDEQRAAEDRLRSNLSILQTVMDNTTDLIYVKDRAGRYLLMNRAGAELARRPVHEIIGLRDVEVLPPEQADHARQRDQLLFAAGHALTYEESGQYEGRKFTMLTTKSPFRDAAGEMIGLIGLSRDITQRIEQVEALSESERRYRTLVTSSNVGIYETDRHGLTLYLNPRWAELTGRPAESGEGEGWIDSLHPDDRVPVNEAFAQTLRTGAPFAMEYRYLTPSGGVTWVYGTAVPIRDDLGAVTGYLGNVIDISDQKRAVIELQLSEERFRRLADSAPVLIWTTTLDGRLTYCNRAWLEFIGRSLEKELDHGWLDGVHPNHREQFLRDYVEAEQSQSELSLEFQLCRADGEYRWMHLTGAPKLVGSDEFRGFIGSCFDITDQRRATETLQRAKEELEHHVAERTAALQEANRQLQQLLIERARAEEQLQQQQGHLAHVSRLSVMGEMAAGLAHELNQPLFAIQNYTAGILRRWSSPEDCRPELREVISQIALESQRAAVIIRRVREFARKQIGERIFISLNTIVREVLQLLGSELRQHKVHVILSLAEQLPEVHVDLVQIQQVLVNLVRNAIESMEALPAPLRHVTISTFLGAGDVHCLVQDSGPGISREVRRRLFEPFFTTKREGLGMGLSISRSIAEAHGGMLQAEDLSVGAAFHFSIPLTEDPLDDARVDRTNRVLGG